jgi:branched-chain amino acid transport system substrate-binding protein
MAADDVQGAIAAAWAAELGLKSVWLLDDGDQISRMMGEGFLEAGQKLGFQVKGRASIDKDAPSFAAVAAPIREADVDLVYFSGVTESGAAQLWKDLRAALARPRLMGTDGIHSQAFLDAAGEAAEGTLFSTPALPPDDKLSGPARDWRRRYREKFKEEPEQFDIYAYEAARIAVAAIRRAGKKDRAAVRDAVLQTRDFDTSLGKLSFDANGDSTLAALSTGTIKRQQGALIFDYERQVAAR